MAKYKYRMGYGLAISPEKDMQMFAKMSAKGWHLTENQGFLYRFEQGEPHEYIYELNMDMETEEDMYSLYEESGWTPVIKEKGMHIFRAEKGTPPIFSDSESKVELLEKERWIFGFYALGWESRWCLSLCLPVCLKASCGWCRFCSSGCSSYSDSSRLWDFAGRSGRKSKRWSTDAADFCLICKFSSPFLCRFYKITFAYCSFKMIVL